MPDTPDDLVPLDADHPESDAARRDRWVSSEDIRTVADPSQPEASKGVTLPRQVAAELRILQSVLDSLGDALIVVDPDGRVVLCNPATSELIGRDLHGLSLEEWTRDYVMFRSDGFTSYPREERPLVRALRGETVEREQVYMTDATTARAKWFSVSAAPLRDEIGAVQGAFSVLRDMTREKRNEEILRLHDSALQSSSEGVTLADATRPGAPIVYANRGFEHMTGYSCEELLRLGWHALHGPETSQKALQVIRDAIRTRSECRVELVNYRKDGTQYWCRVAVTPMHDDYGRLTHFVGVHSDITELKRTEERLRAARDQLREAYRRMKRNIDAAADVQKALLPSHLPKAPWGSVAWRFLASEELAGDILNAFRLDENHLGLYVLDVCGHGVAAALLSVTVRRFLSASFSPSSMVIDYQGDPSRLRIVPPAEVAERLNRRFAWDAERGQFFTVVYGVLNTRTRELRYVLAGHPRPILLPAKGAPASLKGSGYPIGIMDEPHEEYAIQLEPGDRLLFYSDGVPDARTSANELFGDARLIRALEEGRDKPLDVCVEHVLRRVRAWCGNAPLRDDVSLLAVGLAPQPGDDED